jgi:hypothetical protein
MSKGRDRERERKRRRRKKEAMSYILRRRDDECVSTNEYSVDSLSSLDENRQVLVKRANARSHENDDSSLENSVI